MKLILASDNAHKLREFREILAPRGMEILSKREAGYTGEVEENGSTFAENARIKAEAVMKATGLATIADDSGLCVDALNGEPGIYSARYTGKHSDTDADRCRLLLNNLGGRTDRSARFVCAICCALPNGDFIEAVGTMEGEIQREATGQGGFGYDPLFRPAGYSCSSAELSPEEKNAISHRGNALKEFITKWEKYYDHQ